MKIHRNFTKLVNDTEHGVILMEQEDDHKPILEKLHARAIHNESHEYKLTMSVEHDKTVIHVQPILHVFETETDPPPINYEPEPWVLAVAIGTAILLFILAALLLFCCCCSYCPLFEWRRRRRKLQKQVAADIAWRRRSMNFTAPKFEHANGNVAENGDIGKVNLGALESAPPPAGDLETSGLLASTPSSAFDENKVAGPPSVITSTDFRSLSNAMPDIEQKSSVKGRQPVSPPSSINRTFWEMEALYSPSRTSQTTSIDSCIITANNRHLITGSTHGPPCIWDIQTGSLMTAFEGQDSASENLHLAANDKVLVAMVRDHLIDPPRMQIWDMSTTSRIHLSYPLHVSAIATLHSQPLVVLAQFDPDATANPVLVVWDVLANEEVRLIPFQHPNGMGTDGGLTFMSVSFDDRLVLTGFTNLETNESCFMVFDLHADHGEAILDPLVIPIDARLNCTVITSGQWEAASGTRQGHLMLWSMMSGQLVRQLLTSTVTGQLIDNDSTAHPHEITILVNSHDGHIIASGDANGIVHFWSGRTGQWKATVHVPLLSAIVISNDAHFVITGSSSGNIHLWQSSNGHPIGQMSTVLDIVSLMLPNDNSVIVVLGNNRHETDDRGMIILRLTRNNNKLMGRSSSAESIRSFTTLKVNGAIL